MTLRSGVVLCGDGSVFQSADAGISWRRVAAIPGARAVDFLSSTLGFMARTDSACVGVQVARSDDGGRRWQPLACVGLDAKQPLALAFAPNRQQGLLIGPADVFRTSDGGRTWHENTDRRRSRASGIGTHNVPF
jgi:photosystem II stability/assembly factor-like uncharacterized protein